MSITTSTGIKIPRGTGMTTSVSGTGWVVPTTTSTTTLGIHPLAGSISSSGYRVPQSTRHICAQCFNQSYSLGTSTTTAYSLVPSQVNEDTLLFRYYDIVSLSAPFFSIFKKLDITDKNYSDFYTVDMCIHIRMKHERWAG